jgi:hypothetical protein
MFLERNTPKTGFEKACIFLVFDSKCIDFEGYEISRPFRTVVGISNL